MNNNLFLYLRGLDCSALQIGIEIQTIIVGIDIKSNVDKID